MREWQPTPTDPTVRIRVPGPAAETGPAGRTGEPPGPGRALRRRRPWRRTRVTLCLAAGLAGVAARAWAGEVPALPVPAFRFPDPPREGAADFFRIAENGRARCRIVQPAGASRALQATVRAFQAYLKLATGADLPVVTETPGDSSRQPAIHVGDTTRARTVDLGLPDLDYGGDRFPNRRGYLIRTPDRRTLIIRGASDAATAHGVVGFLKRYVGVRSYWPGPPGGLGDVIPARPTLAVPEIEWRDWPYWYSVAITGGPFTNRPGPTLDFYRRHVTLPCNENYHQWLPPERYAAAHPEYYALINGVRVTPRTNAPARSWQPCVSNPDVPRLMAEAVREYFRAHPEAVGVNVAINDGGGDCTCALCRAWDDPPDADAARDGRSARYVRLTNLIAERVAAEFPDRWLVYLAYGAAREAPRSVRPHSRLLPVLTTPGNTFAAWDQWQALGPRHLGLYVHHDDAFFVLPKFDPHQMARRLAYAVASGRARVFYMEWHGQWPFGDVVPYLTAELLWDPRQDVEALLGEYYRAFYGPAAEAMRAFHQALEDGYTRWLAAAGRPHPFGPDLSSLRDYATTEQFRVLTPAEAARAQAALDRALAAVAPDRREAARLRVIQAQFRLQEMAVRWAWAAFRLAEDPVHSAADAKRVVADTRTVYALSARMGDYITNTLERPPWVAYGLFRKSARPAALYEALRSGRPPPEVRGMVQRGLQAADAWWRTTHGPAEAAAWWRRQAETAAEAGAAEEFAGLARRGAGPPPVNLLPDPGFESAAPAGAEGEVTLDDAAAARLGLHHWFPERSPGYRYSLSPEAHSGRWALSIERMQRCRFARSVSRVTPGARYRVGLWFQHNAGGAGYRFAVAVLGQDGVSEEPVSLRVPPRPGEWQELAAEIVAPPGARVISLRLYVNYQAPDARCWVDDAFIGRLAE